MKSCSLNNPAPAGATINTGPEKPIKRWIYVEGHFKGSQIGFSAAIVNRVVYVGSYWNNIENPPYYEDKSGDNYAFKRKI